MTPKRFLPLAAAFALLASAAPAAAQLSDLRGTVGGVVGSVGDTVGNVGGAVGNVGGAVGGAVGDTVGGLRDTVGETVDRVDDLGRRTVRELREARAQTTETLRRQYPDLVDVDRDGALVLRSEVLALSPTSAALEAARAQGFSIAETQETLGLTIVTLRAPNGMTTRRAIETLRELDPEGAYEYNHVYVGAGVSSSSPARMLQAGDRGGGGAMTRVGLVDSGVDVSHPAFANASLRQRGFVAREAIADDHGTAVGSLLVGADADFHGAAPGASLYVADVYGGSPAGGGASAIVAAFGWLAEQGAPVINVSLVGPPNRALEAGVRALIARGHIVVAAVGNDGPNAPPLYPAAYEGVVGVTGVDARNRALPEAGRGAQVDFAAPGSDMAAAGPGGSYARVRGTSYAAPIVAGLLARQLSAPGPDAAARAQAALAQQAADLGSRGPDRTFGAGLVGADLRTAPQNVAAR